MRKVLTQQFFNRPTLSVAEELLGKYLVRKEKGKETAYKVIEVEAYDGFLDKASHAHRGKTGRNEVMFGKAGTIYIYLTYGMHYMLNIVTGKKEYPAAVLLRGLESISGPGRLTKKLHIDKRMNKKPANKETGLWFEDRGEKINRKDIKKTPRIGVHYAGVWSKKPYRFVLK